MSPHTSLPPHPKFSGLLSFLSRLALETSHSISCYTLKSLYSHQTSNCLHLPQEVRAEFWHNLYVTWKCMGFPSGSAGKEPACNAGGLCSIPGLGRSPGEGTATNSSILGLENSMGCIVYGVSKSRTRMSDFHVHYLFGTVSQSYLRCCLQGCNPHFAPNKTTCSPHIVNLF